MCDIGIFGLRGDYRSVFKAVFIYKLIIVWLAIKKFFFSFGIKFVEGNIIYEEMLVCYLYFLSLMFILSINNLFVM